MFAGQVDMGAYENLTIPGDLDGDGQVGGSDLDVIRANWGQTVPPWSFADGDPSGDGMVGGADLDIVRANWGETAPAASAIEVASVGADVAPGSTEPLVGTNMYGPATKSDAFLRATRDRVFANAETLADAAWAEAVESLKTRREGREARVVDAVLKGMGWGVLIRNHEIHKTHEKE